MATRLVLVGGFLGAGKTTLLLEAAKKLAEQGHRVGVVMNDQGQGLVDTALSHDRNIPVAEVAGGCFCCRFPDLLDSVRQLQDTVNPDIILGEPVGSCTDLVATILQPLRTQYPDQFELAPLTILLDQQRDVGGFPATVSYLYDQQIAEADIIGLSKSDLIPPTQIRDQVDALTRRYPHTRVMSFSSQTGEGLAEWLEAILTETSTEKPTLDLNYDTYAEAEACLGWLNAKGTLSAAQPFSATEWMAQTLANLERAMVAQGMSIAHVKMHLTNPDATIRVKASLTQVGRPISWDSRPAESATEQANFTLNARVGSDPQPLEALVRSVVPQTDLGVEIHTELTSMECFSPLPPRPTFRLIVEHP